MKFMFYFNKKGFIFSSNVHEVSKETRKQQIYEQALPIAPSVYQDDDALWRPNADRTMRKPTYTFHLSVSRPSGFGGPSIWPYR